MSTVFISYASSDRELAETIAEALRQVGFEPWLDREEMPPGEDLERGLRCGLARADCGVFLIGREWLGSDWTRGEIQKFATGDGRRRRIGILREPRKVLEDELPFALSQRVTMEWLDETDLYEGMYCLICGIRGQKPGNRKQWKAKGQAYLEEGSAKPFVPVTHPQPAAPLPGKSVLQCDRKDEWATFDQVQKLNEHKAVLLLGSGGAGHDYFLARIQAAVENEPGQHRVRRIQWWPDRPVRREEYRRSIACALKEGASESELPRLLGEWMRARNLVLIHPEIREDFKDRSLIAYYTQWLPELLRSVNPQSQLTCIQPIVFDDGAVSMLRRFWRWGAASDDNDARFLIDRMIDEPDPQDGVITPAVRITLGPILPADVETFCRNERMSDGEIGSIMKATKGASPREILKILDTRTSGRRPQK